PQQDPTKPVDLTELRERMDAIRSQKLRPLIQNVLAGRAPTPPPSQRTAEQPSRYRAWRTVTSTVANVATELGVASAPALLALLRPSHASEIQDSPADHTEWE